MRKNKWNPPHDAQVLHCYKELREVYCNFLKPKPDKRPMPFGVILGRPGLCKDQVAMEMTKGEDGVPYDGVGFYRGTSSLIRFHIWAYLWRDKPRILSDCDQMLIDKNQLEAIVRLTETSLSSRRMQYDKHSKILDEEGVPRYYFCQGSTMLISNVWDCEDVSAQKLESRGDIFVFKPDWYECYREWCKWFWDQEIMDYIHERLDNLNEPDVRLIMKAYNRKHGGLKLVSWQRLIDGYVLHPDELLVRQLLENDKTMGEREKEFEQKTGHSRATFWRYKKKIEDLTNSGKKPQKITLKNDKPPVEMVPKDAVIGDNDDED